ncbi:MAG TPA: signal peptidase I [Candidatus Acidoferrum sp.]|nr:signal peptidase I [Candidatus Acidoferrum sp.]
MSRRPSGRLVEVVETLVLTLIIFLVIQTFVAQPYQVKQDSMEHTVEPDQFVLVDKLTPRFAPYARGDIVVFDPPVGAATADRTPFIKRVIGVAGDTIQIGQDGLVYVNGTKLVEPYLFATNGRAQPTTTSGQSVWHVPDGQLFVLGDHRQVSTDSRVFGTVPVSSVVGRAWLRYWPLNVFGTLQNPGHPELASPAP